MKTLLLPILCICLASLGAESRRHRGDDEEGKIVGGTDIDIKQAAYQVSIQKRGYHFCGGSLINRRFILSAAHCFEKARPEDLTVRVGSSRYNQGGELIKVKWIKIHPRYNAKESSNDIAVVALAEPTSAGGAAKIMPWTHRPKKAKYSNDIAILKLEEPVKFNENVKPILMAHRDPQPGDRVFISGWGATAEGSHHSPEHLKGVTVPVITKEACQRQYSIFTKILPTMFCAGLDQGGKDSCQGDSGGPAVIGGRLAGVVSFGNGCARAHYAGVYTQVNKFIPWVRETISAY